MDVNYNAYNNEKTGKSIEELIQSSMSTIQNEADNDVYIDENGVVHNENEALKANVQYNQSAMIAGINPKQKVDVVDLSSKFSNDSTLTKKDLTNHIKSLIGLKVSSKDKKALLNFIKTSKRVGKKDVFIPKHIVNSSMYNKSNLAERNTSIKNIVDLIKNSVLIDVEPNSKKNTKPNVDNYLRFYVPIKINNEIYTVRITAENNAQNNLFNILSADVYDLIIDKKMTTSRPSTKGNIIKSSSNNNITDSENNFNPNQITIEEMLKGVTGADGKIYFQSENVGSSPNLQAIFNPNKTYYQSAYNEASALFDKFGQSEEELTNMILADVKNTILENNLSEEEFNLVGVKLYGSFSTGKNNNNSDIDFLVEYSGSMREDDAFNMFADLKLKIPDKNGKNIKVDINPIKADVSGTIDDYIEKNKNFVKTYYQGDSHKIYQLSRKDGNNVNVEYYDNSDIEEVKPLNIRNLKFKNVQNVKEIKKTDIKNAVFGTKEKILIQNKKSKINAVLTLNNLKKIISSVFSSDKQNTHARLEKEIISNVETIFENAIPILKHNELKNENLYDTQIIHRFALPVKIGGNNFLTMITVKERKDFKEMAIDEFAIYDLNSKITYKKMFDRSSMSEDLKKSGQSRSQTSNISMTDILDFVNSNLDKYKVTLNQEGIQSNKNNIKVSFENVRKNLYTILDNASSFDTKTKGYKIDIKQTDEKRNGKKPTNVINKLMKKGNIKLNQSAIKRNNKYLANIELLINNARKTNDVIANTKSSEKPHVKNYHNFDVNVLLGDVVYTVRLQTEEWLSDKEIDGVKTFHLYNIYERKKTSRLVAKDNMGSSPLEVNDSVNENENIVNLNVNNHEVQILNQEGKNNEDDIDYTERIFNKINIENKEQFDDFVDNFSSEQTRASITFEYKPLNEPKAIIELFENADKSSFLHEMAHLFLQDIINASKTNDEAKRELDRINDFLGHTQGEYTRQEHEKLVGWV